MKKRTPKDRALEQIAELGQALDQLPKDRQEAFEELLDGPARCLLAPDTITRIAAEPAAVVRQFRYGVLDAGRAHLLTTEAIAIGLQRRILDAERREEIRSLLLVVATEETDLVRMAHDQLLVLVTDDQELTGSAGLLDVTVWDYARIRSHICGHE